MQCGSGWCARGTYGSWPPTWRVVSPTNGGSQAAASPLVSRSLALRRDGARLSKPEGTIVGGKASIPLGIGFFGFLAPRASGFPAGHALCLEELPEARPVVRRFSTLPPRPKGGLRFFPGYLPARRAGRLGG